MVEKRVNKFGQGPPPPLFGQCPKEIDFSYGRCSLSCLGLAARKSNPERDSVLMVGLTALFKWLVSISISIPLQECHHY